MKIFTLLLICTLASAEEGEGINRDPETVEDELRLIHIEMKDMESLLRDDRHSEAVKLDGQKIDDDLTKLIKEIEDAMRHEKEPTNKGEADRWRKLRALGGKGSGNAVKQNQQRGLLHEGGRILGQLVEAVERKTR